VRQLTAGQCRAIVAGYRRRHPERFLWFPRKNF
jgi:hypothetical protein